MGIDQRLVISVRNCHLHVVNPEVVILGGIMGQEGLRPRIFRWLLQDACPKHCR